jgi:hypothetical protein
MVGRHLKRPHRFVCMTDDATAQSLIARIFS